MNNLIKRLIVTLLAMALVGCSSLQVVARSQASAAEVLNAQPPALKAGDELALTLKDGERFTLVLGAVSAAQLAGTVNGVPRTVPAEQIAAIERRQPDHLLTALLVLLLVALVQAAVGTAKAVTQLQPG